MPRELSTYLNNSKGRKRLTYIFNILTIITEMEIKTKVICYVSWIKPAKCIYVYIDKKNTQYLQGCREKDICITTGRRIIQ